MESDQAYPIYIKEFISSSGGLIIENIFSKEKKKEEIILELFENERYMHCINQPYSSWRNMVDCGS